MILLGQKGRARYSFFIIHFIAADPVHIVKKRFKIINKQLKQAQNALFGPICHYFLIPFFKKVWYNTLNFLIGGETCEVL